MRCEVLITDDVNETTRFSGISHEFSEGEMTMEVNCRLRNFDDSVYSMLITYVIDRPATPDTLTADIPTTGDLRGHQLRTMAFGDEPLWIENASSLSDVWSTVVVKQEEHDFVRYDRHCTVTTKIDYRTSVSQLKNATTEDALVERVRFMVDVDGRLDYTRVDYAGVDGVILVGEGAFTTDELTLIRDGKRLVKLFKGSASPGTDMVEYARLGDKIEMSVIVDSVGEPGSGTSLVDWERKCKWITDNQYWIEGEVYPGGRTVLWVCRNGDNHSAGCKPHFCEVLTEIY